MPIANFNFYNPTRVIFGTNTICELDKYLPKDKIFILCYGAGSIKKNGVYGQVVKALGSRKHEEFGGIEPNPDYDTLMKCVDKCKQIGLDKVYILSVGGGSTADGCKFICAAACYTDGEPYEMLFNNAINVKKALPLAVVLTLPATGSESNKNSVISYRKMNRKQMITNEYLFPEIAILDPNTMISLPLSQIQNGVVDAFVHICEQYVTVLQDADCQDRYCEGILMTLVKNGAKIIKDKNDYVARSNIMWAANQALNTLVGQGVPQDWATHYIGHELTANLDLDHGQTLALVQPRLFELKIENKKDKLALLGEKVFGIKESSVLESAKKTIIAIENFYNNVLGVKTRISQLSCSQDKSWIEPLIERLKKDNIKWGEHGDITYVEVKEIINRCY
uniref:Alcohol dehydrogenase YqhD n=1 Tax=Opalinidae sp. TaxID=2059444 RepID=A0A649UYZ0_9STRA|nr:alcohol dehydrogenase YqhD [Opalinidae sp.]